MRSRDKLQPCHTGCDSKEEGNGIDGRAQRRFSRTRGRPIARKDGQSARKPHSPEIERNAILREKEGRIRGRAVRLATGRKTRNEHKT